MSANLLNKRSQKIARCIGAKKRIEQMVLSYFCVWLGGMIARIMAKLDNLSFLDLDAVNVALPESGLADNFCYFVNEFK